MAIKKIICAVVLTASSWITYAGGMGDWQVANPWSVAAGLGYSWYDFAYHGGALADPSAQNAIGDGQTALGRFAVARQVAQFYSIHYGLELGIQSGNLMRLAISQSTLDVLGGLPVQANIKPWLDFLVTATTEPLMNASGILKAGIAYRRMQIDERVTINDLSQVGFELQAGVGMQITDRAQLALLFQGVFNGNANFAVNAEADTGHLANIPMQNGVLLTLSYTL